MDSTLNNCVRLESLNLDHTKELYDLTESNRNYLREWLPWLDHIKDSSDTKNFINTFTEEGAPPQFCVLYKDKICGIVGFHQINRQHKIGSVGYWLDHNHMGNGIITTAVKHLLKFGFSEHNLHKIEIRCAEDNLKSRAIAERLGFVHEATLRDCEWLYTKYVNHAVYTLIDTEFNA